MEGTLYTKLMHEIFVNLTFESWWRKSKSIFRYARPRRTSRLASQARLRVCTSPAHQAQMSHASGSATRKVRQRPLSHRAWHASHARDSPATMWCMRVGAGRNWEQGSDGEQGRVNVGVRNVCGLCHTALFHLERASVFIESYQS
jgi:hypothetical protein